ncbi:MAG: bifunctional PIG-L family deacetylase/class I SAM-dependent methyltransferase [Microbacterium sp.]|uniref:PIG-L family deacetylase n=1 Tax=Microbacterium sp. TaxID=51671 RepID=UPI0039E43862
MMSIAFDHREPGTPEARWQDAEPWRDAQPLDLGVERVVVLAAHPDDESLGAGGLIATAAARGIDVDVVAVTDGERSHPEISEPSQLARRRREELVRAVHRLAPAARLSFLGIPDGAVREHRQRVADAVAGVVRSADPGRVLVAAPWWGDGHRDHRVLGEIAVSLAGAGVQVVGYPIWMWHWAEPDAVDPTDWRLLALPDPVCSAKADAVAEHASQLHASTSDGVPMLHADTLAHFARPFEVFIVPPGSAGPAPADFEAFHARHADPWGLGTRWYERRKRSLLLASLPREEFRRVIELGCAGGETTRVLAERARHVTAVDASATALQRAAARDLPGVEWLQADLPAQWPAGDADLVVLSELAYYWSAAQLAAALDRIDVSVDEDGVLVACHWRHPIPGAPLTGDDVHTAIAGRAEWVRLARHVEEDFLLDVFVRPGMPSVAAGAGLTP